VPRKPKTETYRGVYQKVKGANLWWVRWVDIKGERRTICAGNYSTAVKLSDEKQLERRIGQLLPLNVRKGCKFSEVVAIGVKFSEDSKQGDAKGFKARAELPLEEFGGRMADSITTPEMQEWMDEMAAERDWSAGTRNRYKSTISSCFREAQRAAKVVSNPMRLVRRQREPEGRLRYLLGEEEALLRAKIRGPLNGRANGSAQACLDQMDIALLTGMRRGEQFTVSLDQVNLGEGHIFLVKTKNGYSRYVHLNSAAQAITKRLLAEHERRGHAPTTKLFFAQDGEKIANPRKWFETALAQANIKGVTWHTLRHTFCSRLVMADVPLERVSELAGHKSLSVTRRYAHLAPSKLREALERLVSPSVSSEGDGGLLEALQRLARNGSLLEALQPASTPLGTIPVQNGSQNGSLAQNGVFGQGRDVAVSR
jgi:site-specific recombinase XerD